MRTNEKVVRAAGIEPARLAAADFKSDASTNFAMPAPGRIIALVRVSAICLGLSIFRNRKAFPQNAISWA
jgi:hypothetical protein